MIAHLLGVKGPENGQLDALRRRYLRFLLPFLWVNVAIVTAGTWWNAQASLLLVGIVATALAAIPTAMG